jgi:streptogramin lyase
MCGQLWLGHERGLTRLDPHTSAVRRFTQAQGLPAIHFTGGVCQTKAGEFLFGSRDGILVFRPEQPLTNATPPQVVIESVQASDPRATNNQARGSRNAAGG